MAAETRHIGPAIPAGTDAVGRRIAAALADALVIAAAFVVIGVVSGNAYSNSDGSVGVSLQGVTALVFFVLVIAYYLVPEVLWQATLGKGLLGLRVVTADAGRPTAGSIAVRTVLRVIDGLPFLYLLGLVVILATGRKHQRVGDLAGGTFVVRRSR